MKICINVSRKSLDEKMFQYGEDCYNKEIGNELKRYLLLNGHEVKIINPSHAYDIEDNNLQRVLEANNFCADLLVTIETNDYEGLVSGASVYATDKDAIAIGNEVLNNLNNSGIGYKNNGVKNGKGVFVIDKANMPSLLINCFCSNNGNDLSIYKNSFGAEFIGNSISSAIDNYFSI